MSQPPSSERWLKGIGVAPGFAVGPAYIFAKDSFAFDAQHVAEADVANELERFERAVGKAEAELSKIAAVAREKLGDESASIFEAQGMMLRDVALYHEVIERIRESREAAGYAVQRVMEAHRQHLEAMGNEMLRERVNDLADVQSRLQRHLQRGTIVSKVPPHSVVLAESLTAADIILFSRRHIRGCATSFGGPTSHVSLMARALGIPSVVSLHDFIREVRTGDTVILDGLRGRLIVRPTPETLERYERKRALYDKFVKENEALNPLPAVTRDGERVQLFANIEVQEEYPLVRHHRADGVGLFRTEMLFLSQGRFPTEREQINAYRSAVEAVRPNVTTFRLFDLGGDKVMPLGHREHNPFLGWRGIRILLDRPEILETQVRAILRASEAGPVRILIPMVTEIDEIARFKVIYEEQRRRLISQGVDVSEDVPIGAMIEVPSVAFMAREVSREVDFFSLGTNDLTQYMLAVDRGNDLVSELYHELHPAVLSVIRRVIQAADEAGIPVSVCGEMASQPRAVPILFGLGLREFSASPSYLPQIKRVIRAISRPGAEALAKAALRSRSAVEVENRVDVWLREHACDIAQLLDLGMAEPDTLPAGEPILPG